MLRRRILDRLRDAATAVVEPKEVKVGDDGGDFAYDFDFAPGMKDIRRRTRSSEVVIFVGRVVDRLGRGLDSSVVVGADGGGGGGGVFSSTSAMTSTDGREELGTEEARERVNFDVRRHSLDMVLWRLARGAGARAGVGIEGIVADEGMIGADVMVMGDGGVGGVGGAGRVGRGTELLRLAGGALGIPKSRCSTNLEGD